MTNNENLSIMTELHPIAKRMREREEQIKHGKKLVLNHVCETVALGAEQGRDVTLVKSRLGKHSSWDEWRAAHVPNMSLDESLLYERMSKENAERNLGQFFFPFLPSNRTRLEDAVQRLPPNAREVLWARIAKLNSALTTIDIEAWTEQDKELTRHELEPTAKLLWPERFA